MSRLRLRLAVFFVKICRACEWPRLNLPDAVERKRFAAPLCVFSFGISALLKSGSGCRLRPSPVIKFSKRLNKKKEKKNNKEAAKTKFKNLKKNNKAQNRNYDLNLKFKKIEKN